MATQIETDASRILQTIAEWSQGPRDTKRGRYSVNGEDLLRATRLDPDRINDAVQVLVSNGYLEVAQYAGSAPFYFSFAELTSSGRLAYQRSTPTSPSTPRTEPHQPMRDMPEPDKKKVFIIHGRNTAARTAVEHFVTALGLQPVDFDQLAADQGGTAFIGDIVRAGMEQAHAIIALFTPDEYAALRSDHRGAHEKPEELRRWQARPNVIFEAGMAYGTAPKRTVLVTLGSDVALFSDVSGVHVVRLSNSVDSRSKLRQKLIGMGSEVDTRSDAWTNPARAGDFEACIGALKDAHPNDPFEQQPNVAREPPTEEALSVGRGMTERAQRLLRKIAAEYVEAGYPGIESASFSCDDPSDTRLFNELRARGYVVRFTADSWRLTEEGEEWVMQHMAPT